VTLGAGTGTVINNNEVLAHDIGLYRLPAPFCCAVSRNHVFDNRFFGVVIQDGSNAAARDRVSGGRVGVAVVADAADRVAKFGNEAISGASMATVQELSCCGFRAVALVHGR